MGNFYMAKINRYKVKPGTMVDDLVKNGFKAGGTWVNKNAVWYRSHCIRLDGLEFDVDVVSPANIDEFNDFDCVLVMDSDFGQPYTPFYKHYGEEVTNFPCLEYVIHGYNKFLGSIPFLEEVSMRD